MKNDNSNQKSIEEKVHIHCHSCGAEYKIKQSLFQEKSGKKLICKKCKSKMPIPVSDKNKSNSYTVKTNLLNDKNLNSEIDKNGNNQSSTITKINVFFLIVITILLIIIVIFQARKLLSSETTSNPSINFYSYIQSEIDQQKPKDLKVSLILPGDAMPTKCIIVMIADFTNGWALVESHFGVHYLNLNTVSHINLVPNQ